MRVETGVPLSPLTTLALGGRARRLVEVTSAEEILEAVRAADRSAEPLLVLAGGSNVVISDKGVDGTVLLVRSQGLTTERRGDEVCVTVQAGHPWDELVAECVSEGLAGIECLSGIPGSTGATPIQNVGAYGQEVAETIRAVSVYDRAADEVRTLTPAECGFGYRHSAFRGDDRRLVLSVTFGLRAGLQSGPLRYGELSRVIGGSTGTLGDVRDAVLALRRSKGMVLDPEDPDTRSVGSFFTNPVLDQIDWGTLLEACEETPPHWAEPDNRVKTSAAWLIERSGFTKGYGRDGVAISGKHTLALTNRGTGSTAALLALAREIRDGVAERFGVTLLNEPVLVGVTL